MRPPGPLLHHCRVNHKIQYSDFGADCTIRYCESFNARLERCLMGVHQYTTTSRRSTQSSTQRRSPSGRTYAESATEASSRKRRDAMSPASKDWCGNWQANHRATDGLDALYVGGWDPADLNARRPVYGAAGTMYFAIKSAQNRLHIFV